MRPPKTRSGLRSPTTFIALDLGLYQSGHNRPQRGELNMRRLIWAVLSLVLLFAVSISAQNSNTATNANKNSKKPSTNANRKPPFRANADQIKQAQAILKQKNFYSGDQTGKLDD